jgi:hypothetical protein
LRLAVPDCSSGLCNAHCTHLTRALDSLRGFALFSQAAMRECGCMAYFAGDGSAEAGAALALDG